MALVVQLMFIEIDYIFFDRCENCHIDLSFYSNFEKSYKQSSKDSTKKKLLLKKLSRNM